MAPWWHAALSLRGGELNRWQGYPSLVWKTAGSVVW
jgi:hypothetical protein